MNAFARKLVRYAGVSAISTTVSLTILGALVWTRTLTPGWANVIATGIGTIPSFELNRRWVWGKTGTRSLPAEVGPFCTLAFAGLAISTWAVSQAVGWTSRAGLGSEARTLAAEAANVATFGSLWVFQYFMLDRVLFRQRSTADHGRGFTIRWDTDTSVTRSGASPGDASRAA